MAKVTLEDVRAAVEKLEAEGLSVSVVNVRSVLRRGSSTTITNFLREVRKSKTCKERLPQDIDTRGVPPEVIQRIAEAAQSAAIVAFHAIVDPINNAIAAARVDMDTERQSLLQDNAQVSADAADALERLESARRELHDAIRESAKTKAELTAAGERLLSAEKRRDEERIQMQEEINRMRAQNASAQVEWSHKQERLHQRLEVAINEAAELRGRLSVFEGRA